MSRYYQPESGKSSFFQNLLATSLFYFFKLFGFGPISYERAWTIDKKSISLVFKFSWVAVIYNVILIVLAATINYFYLAYMYETDYGSDVHNSTMIIAFVTLCAGTMILTLVIYVYQNLQMVNIANRMYKLMELTEAINKDLKKKSKKMFDFISIITIGIFISGFVAAIVLEEVLSKDEDLLDFDIVSMYPFVFQVNIFSIFCLLLQYTLILKVLNESFWLINETLRDFLARPHFWYVELYRSENLNVQLRIDKLIHLYTFSHDLSRKLSAFYCLPMIWTTLDCFILLVLEFFVFFENLFNSKPDPFWHSSILVVHLLVCAALLTILTVCVTNTVNESKKTGKIAHDCLKISKNTQIEDKLRQFLSNLEYERVSFSVYGFFSLDESFLMSFAGSLVTYLVILIQFNISGQPKPTDAPPSSASIEELN